MAKAQKTPEATGATGEKRRGGSERGRSKHRSPNYPLFDLEKAVDRTKLLYDSDKMHKIPIGVVHERWSYTKGSSAGNQAVAAVKSYGLITVEGDVDDRQIAVSDIGRRIVLGAPDRPELLKAAAVGPTLFASLWDRYRKLGLPKPDVIRHHLVFERNFNEDFVDNAIERFLSTMAFAKLVAGDTLPDGDSDESPPKNVDVGDFVLWTSNGVDQFTSPKQVVRISDDDNWALVEGSETGLPMSELAVVDPPLKEIGGKVVARVPSHNPFTPKIQNELSEKPGFALERSTLDEGAVVLQWPDTLSEASVKDFEYWIQGVLRRAKRKAGIPDSTK